MVPGHFTMAQPVQAGTSVSSEIVSKGLMWQQLINRSMAWAASLSAQVKHQQRATAETSLKHPPPYCLMAWPSTCAL